MIRERTDYIVIHCSATPPSRDIGAAEIDAMHKARGWRCIGYHLVYRLDGTVERGRPLDDVGAHCKSHNLVSVAACLVGGVDENLRPACTVTEAQSAALRADLVWLRQKYQGAEVVGHRNLSPDLDGDGVIERHEWMKACPSFDVAHWLAGGEAVFQAPP